jgi:uncharacterized RmlC-like cupin family protein
MPVYTSAVGQARGIPHEVFNYSESEPVVAVVARSDAHEWENIVPYDRTRPDQ